jgi:hypothetical protein
VVHRESHYLKRSQTPSDTGTRARISDVNYSIRFDENFYSISRQRARRSTDGSIYRKLVTRGSRTYFEVIDIMVSARCEVFPAKKMRNAGLDSVRSGVGAKDLLRVV